MGFSAFFELKVSRVGMLICWLSNGIFRWSHLLKTVWWRKFLSGLDWWKMTWARPLVKLVGRRNN